MDQFQYYPTPKKLAKKAWALFKNIEFVRVLEPSAGGGDLLDPLLDKSRKGQWHRQEQYHRNHQIPVDCYELDLSKHEPLRGLGLNVVGINFLSCQSAAQYSHIMMNPPFAHGVSHLLHAWRILWDGEIVCILNAETVRNAFSIERQEVCALIKAHGHFKIIEGAFESEDTERKTKVDIALVYLRKKADISAEVYGDLLKDMRADNFNPEDHVPDDIDKGSVAIPNSVIENQVLAFNVAVRARKESTIAAARAAYYSGLLGDTMAAANGDRGSDKASHEASAEWIKKEIAKDYDELKDRAWTWILRSSNVKDKLSAVAQKMIEAQFAKIKTLEFSVSNIYGFLHGLCMSQPEIRIAMACDAFDQISRYHTDNACFFKGWRSNDRHRTCGRRIKHTRFVLPYFDCGDFRPSLSWDKINRLRDFNKVFAMLDGKEVPEVGLADVFGNQFDTLLLAKRVSTDYFDVRYYRGVGTIHFFPRSQEVMDRLNRFVGRHRAWIPPEDVMVSEDFWLQYEKAEKFDKEFRKEVKDASPSRYHNPFTLSGVGSNQRETDESIAAENLLADAMARVLDRHGISTDFRLENQDKPIPPERQLQCA